MASVPGNERGAQAGIEPATGAWITHPDRLSQSGTENVHTRAPIGATTALRAEKRSVPTTRLLLNDRLLARVTLRVT
jgi:hypothetical protein